MSDINQQIDEVARFFDGCVEQYGYSPRGCDYSGWATQKSRFNVMDSVTALDGRSILDVGCGFGDFLDHLEARGWKGEYHGIDISARMIEVASERHPGRSFRVANILVDEVPSADVVVANGIFYLLGADGWRHMQRLVRRLFELSTLALAFSSLSTSASVRDPGEFFADPMKVYEFCRELTPWVVLRHDYHPGDFSIYAYRGPTS